MTRIGMLALCAVAVFALSVMAASSAYASGVCYEKKSGKYINSDCTTPAEGKVKGKYELAAEGSCFPLKKGGEFTNSSCTTIAEKKGAPDHKGKFEQACPAPGPACPAVEVSKVTTGTLVGGLGPSKLQFGPSTTKQNATFKNNTGKWVRIVSSKITKVGKEYVLDKAEGSGGDYCVGKVGGLTAKFEPAPSAGEKCTVFFEFRPEEPTESGEYVMEWQVWNGWFKALGPLFKTSVILESV